MTDLTKDLKKYKSMQAELEAKYMGKWVLIHNETLINTYNSFETAAEDAVARFGRGPYLIRQVGAPPIVLPASLMYQVVRG